MGAGDIRMNIQSVRNQAVVVQPDEGPSYWQPVPANGFSEIVLSPDNTGSDALASGFQTVASGGHIRAHSHADQIELQVCFRGRGAVLVSGKEHPLVPGTTCFLGPGVTHEIINKFDKELVMLWVIAPSGLEKFFAQIGRQRTVGEAVPEPFSRPAETRAIEYERGFRDVK